MHNTLKKQGHWLNLPESLLTYLQTQFRWTLALEWWLLYCSPVKPVPVPGYPVHRFMYSISYFHFVQCTLHLYSAGCTYIYIFVSAYFTFMYCTMLSKFLYYTMYFTFMKCTMNICILQRVLHLYTQSKKYSLLYLYKFFKHIL